MNNIDFSKYSKIIDECVKYPSSWKESSVEEKIENSYINIEPFLDNIYVNKNEKEMITAYWFMYMAKTETNLSDTEIINYVSSNMQFSKKIINPINDIKIAMDYLNE